MTEKDAEKMLVTKVYKMRKNIPATKVYKRRKILSPISRKEDEKIPGSPLVKKDLCNDCDGFSKSKEDEKVCRSPEEVLEEDSESENEICRSPEEVKGLSYYYDPEVYGDLSEDESESDEDLIEDRDEHDWGFSFVVKKRSRTVTNPKIPEKKYFKSDGSESRSIFPVLHDPDFPLAELSKLALKTYNTIWDTEYVYVGLVKAYKQTVNGFRFWTRFKARLPGQDAINFQAITFLGGPNRKTNDATVHFESVYPLPSSPAIRRTEQKIPQRKRRGRGGQYPRRR
ncbi:hypothetical protein POM88_042417 [Heracleum sosnowskyi]|uniref:Uncharacterized protein n=1 Tax=Heracleum sosnowskyi TaxID=360622 RepID=A0AAD8MAN2_9APIA|nr:hypothetical protein POM88_042417 [Heracleum sosnowskyi]